MKPPRPLHTYRTRIPRKAKKQLTGYQRHIWKHARAQHRAWDRRLQKQTNALHQFTQAALGIPKAVARFAESLNATAQTINQAVSQITNERDAA